MTAKFRAQCEVLLINLTQRYPKRFTISEPLLRAFVIFLHETALQPAERSRIMMSARARSGVRTSTWIIQDSRKRPDES